MNVWTIQSRLTNLAKDDFCRMCPLIPCHKRGPYSIAADLANAGKPWPFLLVDPILFPGSVVTG